VHQQAADNSVLWRSIPLPSHRILVKNADRCHIIAVVIELGRVMQHENRTIAAPKTISRRLKVSLQNPCLADLPIGKKTIGSLSVGPILARPWNALSYSARELL
jgi:hypothetical protein